MHSLSVTLPQQLNGRQIDYLLQLYCGNETDTSFERDEQPDESVVLSVARASLAGSFLMAPTPLPDSCWLDMAEGRTPEACAIRPEMTYAAVGIYWMPDKNSTATQEQITDTFDALRAALTIKKAGKGWLA